MKTRVRMESSRYDISYIVEKFKDGKWVFFRAYIDHSAAETEAELESHDNTQSSTIIRQFENGEEVWEK